jgi:hypothetical protein
MRGNIVMTQIDKIVTCKECGREYMKELGFCCNYCGAKDNEDEFHITVEKHTESWGNDSVDSYETAHYCNLFHFLNDFARRKSDFFEDDELKDDGWKYKIEMDKTTLKDLIGSETLRKYG